MTTHDVQIDGFDTVRGFAQIHTDDADSLSNLAAVANTLAEELAVFGPTGASRG